MKKLLSLFVIIGFVGIAFGDNISKARVKDAVGRWADTGGGRKFGMRGAKISRMREHKIGNRTLHEIDFESGGFAIATDDDEIDPIIAFSPTGWIDNKKDNPLLAILKRDMQGRYHSISNSSKNSTGRRVSPRRIWRMLESKSLELDGDEDGGGSSSASGKSSIADVLVAPLLKTQWGQDVVNDVNGNYVPCYNLYTPENSVCGCCATALAQLVRYHAYKCDPGSGTIGCSYNGYNTSLSLKTNPYRWEHMLGDPNDGSCETNWTAIGELTYNCGVALRTAYTLYSSAAGGYCCNQVLKNRFGFASAQTYVESFDDDGIDDETIEERAIRANLDAGYPVLLGIEDYSSGHFVVADGYGKNYGTVYTHINMGWDGLNDLWYSIYYSGIDDFAVLRGIVYNAFPDKTGQIISGRVTTSSGLPAVSVTVSAVDSSGTTVATAITSDTGVYGLIVPGNNSYTVSGRSADGQYSAVYGTVTLGGIRSPSMQLRVGESWMYYSSYYTAVCGNSYGNDFTLNSKYVRPTVSVPQDIPAVYDGSVQTVKLGVSGGVAPYVWSIVDDYTYMTEESTYSETGIPQGWSRATGSWLTDLPFAFPFDGKSYSSLYINGNGSVSFEAPFTATSASVQFHGDRKFIAPLLCSISTLHNIYVEHGSDLVRIRWHGRSSTGYAINASLTLYADGAFRFSYGNSTVAGFRGVGFGGGKDMLVYLDGGTSYSSKIEDVVFARVCPESILIDSDGCLSRTANIDEQMAVVTVTDAIGNVAKAGLALPVKDVVPCTITFDDNGGSCGELSRKVMSGDELSDLPIPKLVGNSFDGWFTEAEKGCGTKIESGYVVTADMTLYAHWTLNVCTLTFDANGGVCSLASTNLNYGEVFALLPMPERADCVFLGWYTAAEDGQGAKIESGYVVTADMVLYAHWFQGALAIVTFDANGGSCVTREVYRKKGDVYSTLPVPVKQGSIFLGWFTEVDGGERVTGNTLVADDAICYAHWREGYAKYIGNTLWYYTIEDGVAVIGYGDYRGELTVPEWLDGYPVRIIGVDAFRGCTELTGLKLPSGITRIRSGAFEGCTGLTWVTLPETVFELGEDAFRDCSALTGARIPSAVTTIPTGCYRGCKSLMFVSIPSTVTTIGINAFRDCFSLTAITLPTSVKRVRGGAFAGCTGITFLSYPLSLGTVSVVFPDSVALGTFRVVAGTTTIPVRAFAGCHNMTGVSLPETLTSIGSYAFEGCSSLTYVRIPNNVTWIGNYAFKGCSGLTAADIPGSVVSVGAGVYQECSGLTRLTISASLKVIPSSFADGCTALASFTIPESVTSICANAFRNCTLFTKVTIPSGVTFLSGSAFDGCSAVRSITWCGDLGTLPAIFPTIRANLKIATVSPGTTTLGRNALQGCTSLTGVNLPSSLKIIGAGAFDGCASLAYVTIPSNVVWIGNYAFRGCEALTGFVMPDSVTAIGSGVFEGCTTLSRIALSSSLTALPSQTFADCSALKSIAIPASVTSISTGAFRNCTMFSTITIPNGVTFTSPHAFDGCTGVRTLTYRGNLGTLAGIFPSICRQLTRVTLAAGTTDIVPYAFRNCTSLTAVVMPSTLRSIGTFAFQGCTGLTGMTLPDCVASLGVGAFSGCTGLVGVRLSRDLVTIGSRAFEGCTSVSYVTIPSNVEWIGNFAFKGCTGLVGAEIPSGVNSLGGGVYQGCVKLGYVSIVSSLTAIPALTFDGCISLSSVVLPSTLVSIGSHAFRNCKSLSTLRMPNSVTFVSEDAFDGCSKLDLIRRSAAKAVKKGSSAMLQAGLLADGCGTYELLVDKDGGTGYLHVTYSNGDVWSGEVATVVCGSCIIASFENGSAMFVLK